LERCKGNGGKDTCEKQAVSAEQPAKVKCFVSQSQAFGDQLRAGEERAVIEPIAQATG